jgi:excisionase family DNA binding protein
MADLGGFLTVDEVAAICRAHPVTVRQWIRAGRLTAFLVGRKQLVYRSHLDLYLESCKGAKGQRPGGRDVQVVAASEPGACAIGCTSPAAYHGRNGRLDCWACPDCGRRWTTVRITETTEITETSKLRAAPVAGTETALPPVSVYRCGDLASPNRDPVAFDDICRCCARRFGFRESGSIPVGCPLPAWAGKTMNRGDA